MSEHTGAADWLDAMRRDPGVLGSGVCALTHAANESTTVSIHTDEAAAILAALSGAAAQQAEPRDTWDEAAEAARIGHIPLAAQPREQERELRELFSRQPKYPLCDCPHPQFAVHEISFKPGEAKAHLHYTCGRGGHFWEEVAALDAAPPQQRTPTFVSCGKPESAHRRGADGTPTCEQRTQPEEEG